jgi:hypothetical protein
MEDDDEEVEPEAEEKYRPSIGKDRPLLLPASFLSRLCGCNSITDCGDVMASVRTNHQPRVFHVPFPPPRSFLDCWQTRNAGKCLVTLRLVTI